MTEATRPAGSKMKRSTILWAAASVVLVAGYADLSRGGVTVAPILLVIGYCILVPLAILA
jgi:hypothetical protein